MNKTKLSTIWNVTRTYLKNGITILVFIMLFLVCLGLLARFYEYSGLRNWIRKRSASVPHDENEEWAENGSARRLEIKEDNGRDAVVKVPVEEARNNYHRVVSPSLENNNSTPTHVKQPSNSSTNARLLGLQKTISGNSSTDSFSQNSGLSISREVSDDRFRKNIQTLDPIEEISSQAPSANSSEQVIEYHPNDRGNWIRIGMLCFVLFFSFCGLFWISCVESWVEEEYCDKVSEMFMPLFHIVDQKKDLILTDSEYALKIWSILSSISPITFGVNFAILLIMSFLFCGNKSTENELEETPSSTTNVFQNIPIQEKQTNVPTVSSASSSSSPVRNVESSHHDAFLKFLARLDRLEIKYVRGESNGVELPFTKLVHNIIDQSAIFCCFISKHEFDRPNAYRELAWALQKKPEANICIILFEIQDLYQTPIEFQQLMKTKDITMISVPSNSHQGRKKAFGVLRKMIQSQQSAKYVWDLFVCHFSSRKQDRPVIRHPEMNVLDSLAFLVSNVNDADSINALSIIINSQANHNVIEQAEKLTLLACLRGKQKEPTTGVEPLENVSELGSVIEVPISSESDDDTSQGEKEEEDDDEEEEFVEEFES